MPVYRNLEHLVSVAESVTRLSGDASPVTDVCLCSRESNECSTSKPSKKNVTVTRANCCLIKALRGHSNVEQEEGGATGGGGGGRGQSLGLLRG